MKNSMSLLFFLLAILCLTSCQPKDNTALELSFDEIVLTIPEEWRGKYEHVQENADSITVYHTKTREIDKAFGVLFYLGRTEKLSVEARDELIDESANSSILYETAEYTYIISMPTDVQQLTATMEKYSKSIEDEYVMLAAQIEEIKMSARETD